MDHLKVLSKDLRLKRILHLDITLPKKRRNITMGLVSSIMSQQLSTKVATVMRNRFIELFEGKTPSAEMILNMPKPKIKAIGLSQQKTDYIHNVAAFIVEHRVTQAKLNKMSNDEIIDLLTQIKGVGRWTVEMQLMFRLGREDVFAIDDYGIQKAMMNLYKLHSHSKKELREKMIKLSEKWIPYRTYACLYLWNSLDQK